MAANDLGVLLAQSGHYADARVMLEHSLAIRPQATGWRNLATVYRQLGQMAPADRAAQQAMLLRQTETAGQPGSSAPANDRVQWVDPRIFAQTGMNTANPPGTMPLPADPSRAAPIGPSAASVAIARPATRRATAETNPPASAAAPAPDVYWPAPTPAAAQRMTWGAPAYQR
jgi:tetratricopeptide (TPR) repeat protein